MAAYLRGKRYLVEKRDNGGDRRSVGQNVPLKSDRTSASVAAHFGVDEKTVRRDAEFAKAVDELPGYKLPVVFDLTSARPGVDDACV